MRLTSGSRGFESLRLRAKKECKGIPFFVRARRRGSNARQTARAEDYAHKAREAPNARKVKPAEAEDYAPKAREAPNARKVTPAEAKDYAPKARKAPNARKSALFHKK